MDNTLTDLLAIFKNDCDKANFLLKIYHPGNAEAAEKLLNYENLFWAPYNCDIIENILRSEVNYYNKNLALKPSVIIHSSLGSEVHYYNEWKGEVLALKDNFMKFAKKLIELKLEQRDSLKYELISFAKDVIGWGNEELADYAIKMFTQKDSYASHINVAAEIADFFKKPEVKKECLERMLKIYSKDCWDNNEFSINRYMGVLARLEKYEELANLLLEKGDEKGLSKYLSLIRDKVPSKYGELCKKTFEVLKKEHYFFVEGVTEAFADSAMNIGESEYAIKILSGMCNKDNLPYPSNDISRLIKGLIKLDVKKAQEKVDDVFSFLLIGDSEPLLQNVKRAIECAKLLNNASKVEELYEMLVNKKNKVKDYCNSSECFSTCYYAPTAEILCEAYNDTKKLIYLEKAIPIFMHESKYEKAIDAAKTLGNTELMNKIIKIKELVKEAKIKNLA